jgi:MFS family permease
MGTRNSFGIFFTSIENQFDLSRAATSAYFSIFMILSAIFTILCGWALDRIGPKIVFMIMGAVTLVSLVLTGRTTTSWQLFITYSFLLAAGTGAGFSLVLATVSKWFVKRRGLALAIALSGEGAGTLAVAPLATFLISSFHWRTAFLLIGLIAGGLMFFVALFLKKVPTLKTAPASKINQSNAVSPSGFTLKEAAKTRSFWFLATVYMMVSFSFYLILTHIVPHAGDLGINAARAAIIVSLMGGSTIPGRLVIGSASDRYSRKKLAISCAIFEVAAMIWLTQSNSLWMFCVFAVAFGFAFGGISNLMAALIGDTFGMTNLGAISGVLVVGFSFGAAIGPAVGGIIFDATNSYYIAFLVGVGTACLAVVSLALTRREKKHV